LKYSGISVEETRKDPLSVMRVLEFTQRENDYKTTRTIPKKSIPPGN
jgi:hypothetical protein